MNTEDIRKLIAEREATSDEWQAGVERCWEALACAIASDYDAARAFLLEDCTADEASWVSEVYEEIISKTQSKSYIELLRESAKRFPEEDAIHHMSEHLEMAVESVFRG